MRLTARTAALRPTRAAIRRSEKARDEVSGETGSIRRNKVRNKERNSGAIRDAI